MAKNKGNNNNISKAKLKKPKSQNVFKTKASGRTKHVGKAVSTKLRKNLVQSKQVEKSNKSFEAAQDLILMGNSQPKPKKVRSKSPDLLLVKQEQSNVSKTDIEAAANLIGRLWVLLCINKKRIDSQFCQKVSTS